MWSAFPLGAMMGGLLNSYIITQMGWRAIFYIGGVAPLFLALVLFFYLPELIKFLLVRRNDNNAVRRIVARFRSPLVRDGAHFVVEENAYRGHRSGICSHKAALWGRCCCGCRFLWALAY